MNEFVQTEEEFEISDVFPAKTFSSCLGLALLVSFSLFQSSGCVEYILPKRQQIPHTKVLETVF